MASDKKGSNTRDLLAALEAPVRKHPGTICGVTRILGEMTPELRDKVAAIITEIRAARERGGKTVYTASWLANTLTDHGYEVSPLTVGIHIRKACRCE